MIFRTKLTQKGYLQSEREKMNKMHIPISLGNKFYFKQTINFRIKFAQKAYFRLKTEKSEHHQWILHTRTSLGTKFQLELIIFIFWNKFAKKAISCHKQKKWLFTIELIVHTQSSLGTKFQLKLTILIFWTKFVQSKTEK